MPSSELLTFTGNQDFRIRLVLSTLSGKPIRISSIRSGDAEPGLKDYEVSFLRLLEALTNGSTIEISYTGTTIIYRPGIIIGGSFTHKCPLTRAVGYFIEPLLLLAPFSKKPVTINFQGITSSSVDIAVDTIRTSMFPVLQKFGIDRQELRIVKRGAEPLGGGEVILHMPHLLLQPKTIHALETPLVTKVRGIAYSTRTSPDNVNRMIEAAKGVILPSKAETFIYSDVTRGDESGKSPGFGITLVAETKSGWCYSAEGVGAAGLAPEDLGRDVAYKLLEEISMRGVIGKNQATLVLVLMVLGREDVGRITVGKDLVDAKFIRLLRLFKDFWGVEAVIKENEENESELLCLIRGTGFVSASKKIA